MISPIQNQSREKRRSAIKPIKKPENDSIKKPSETEEIRMIPVSA
jgi:hypothetical protein